MINYISSKDNKKVIAATKLKNKKNINENHEFLVEGMKTIELAIKSGHLKEIFTTKELDIDPNIPQYIVNENIVKKMAYSLNPEGVIGICSTLEEKLPASLNKVVYLDDIQDPGNMGTIIRTALAFDYDAIILSKNCVSIYNPKVVAASKGGLFLIPIIEGDLKDFKKDFLVITSSLNDKSLSLDKINKTDKFILVLGNEAHGVSEEVISLTDIFVKIPINNIDSLNVSVAGGILMNYLK